MLSPYSISAALTMCYLGAQDQTSAELKHLLCLQTLTDAQIIELNASYSSFLTSELGTDTSLELANKLYANKRVKIESDYEQKLGKSFQTEVESIDFAQSVQATETMNTWVSAKTNGKITNLIDKSDVNDSLGLVLLNAVYFKAKWAHVFEEGLTKRDDFYLRDGSVQKIDMMELRRKNFKLYRNPMGLRANALEIPYDHFTLSFTIILPDKEDQLDEVAEKLDAATLNNILRTNHELNALVNLQLPKLKFESKHDVSLIMKTGF